MGGGGSKGDHVAASAAKSKGNKVASARSKPKFSDGSTSFDASSYKPHQMSTDVVVLHINPGSDSITTHWLTLDKESGELTRNKSRKPQDIVIMKRASNGGGTVDDIVFLSDAAKNMAEACERTAHLILVVDVLTVEGQAIFKYLWREIEWLKTTRSTVVLILPTFSSERAGVGTTHPSLYGPAWAPLYATITLGIDFGSSFLVSKNKKECEAIGTRVAFVSRHVWYSTVNPILTIVAPVVSRLNLRIKLRDQWEDKTTDPDESFDDTVKEYERVKKKIKDTKTKRRELTESITQRQNERKLKKLTAEKEKFDSADAARQAKEQAKEQAAKQIEEEKCIEEKIRQETETAAKENMAEKNAAKDAWVKGESMSKSEQSEGKTTSNGEQDVGSWSAHLDPGGSGHHYYLHSVTGESTWTKPPNFVEEAYVDANGYNSKSKSFAIKQKMLQEQNQQMAIDSAKGEEEIRGPEKTPTKEKNKKRTKSKKAIKVGGEIDEEELDEYAMEYDKDEELDNFAMEDEYNLDETALEEGGVGEFVMETKLSAEEAAKKSTPEGGGGDEFLDGDDFTMEDDPNNTLEGEYEMAMSTGVNHERRRSVVENHIMWLSDRPTTPTNVLIDQYQEAQMTKSDDVGSKSDQPDGEKEKSLSQQWTDVALKKVRMEISKNGRKSAPIRPPCEIVFYAGTRPEQFSMFLSTSFERLVLHNNAYSDGSSVTQDDLELSVSNLMGLWPTTWQYMHIEGETGDDSDIAQEALSIVEPGAPIEFSRSSCKPLPLGDIGCWPSGGIIIAAGGPNAVDEVDTIKMVVASDSQQKLSKTDRVRETTMFAASVEELLAEPNWKAGEVDCILVVDVDDDVTDVVEFLKTQSTVKQKYKENLLAGKDPDVPPSVVLALLLPPAQGNQKQWSRAAHLLSIDYQYPGSIDLLAFMQNGDASNSQAAILSMARCPVDFSSVCKHLSPFPRIHHAITFAANFEAKTQQGDAGCLVDVGGLSGDVGGQDMGVYVSYSIYSGPGGFADGFCVEGDDSGAARNVVAQIIGTVHRLSPVANAGYGVSSTSTHPEDANSLWCVLAQIPSIIEDVIMRSLQGADNIWNPEEMEKHFTALGELKSSYNEAFPPPEQAQDASGFFS